jgi:hypothetical protein
MQTTGKTQPGALPSFCGLNLNRNPPPHNPSLGDYCPFFDRVFSKMVRLATKLLEETSTVAQKLPGHGPQEVAVSAL